MDIASLPRSKGDKGVVMEGPLADWYAKNTAADLAAFDADARRIAQWLSPGARVLEIAPGPGYLAIALAKLGSFQITGLDISRSFVRIAAANAAKAGMAIDFRHGDASDTALDADTFDFVVCRAAFKNFANPLGALREMHRVLKAGGEALIIDMRRDATDAAIDESVKAMNLSRLNGLLTGFIFRHTLRGRAYTKAEFMRMAEAAPFSRCEVFEDPLGLEVRLRK